MGKSTTKHNKIKCSPNISNKLARSKANRRLRRYSRELLAQGEENLPGLRDVSDTWDFPSDGLATYFPIEGTKWQRR